MKKQISLFVAILLFSAAIVSANQMPIGEAKLIVTIEKSIESVTSLDLRLANLEKKGTLILLQDMNGNNWFSQYVSRKAGFAKRLNLKGMPDGTYTLSVSHKDATVIQALRLSNGVLEVLKHQKMEVPAKKGEDLVKGK
jgi:phenylpyruvate tautomerase PptA (4-oxalocrotonate tautomerase family)